MKRADQLQPPIENTVVIRWREENDPRRLDRLVEILTNILDSGRTPGESRRS